jgi:hypothetical protein
MSRKYFGSQSMLCGVDEQGRLQSLVRGRSYNPAKLRLRDNSACALMSLDFPKRSDRKILERIIPPPSGGRDKLRYAYVSGVINPTSSQMPFRVLRSWDNSTYASNFAWLVISESHYHSLRRIIRPANFSRR